MVNIDLQLLGIFLATEQGWIGMMTFLRLDLEKDQLTVLFVTHKEMKSQELTKEEFRKDHEKYLQFLTDMQKELL